MSETAENSFHAYLTFGQTRLNFTSYTLPEFLGMLEKLGVATPETKAIAPAPKPGKPKPDTPPPPDPKPSTKPAAVIDTPPAVQPSAEAAAAPSPAKTQADAKPIDYSQLKMAILKLANADRDAASILVAGFGVATFRDLDQSRWAEALAAVNAKLNELGVA